MTSFPDGTSEAEVRLVREREDWAKLKADAQALADVRTLDAWASGQLGRRWCVEVADEDGWRVKLFGTSIVADGFFENAPEGARAKAAEWVRKQAATAREGL